MPEDPGSPDDAERAPTPQSPASDASASMRPAGPADGEPDRSLLGPRWSFVAALVLSLTTLASAWSGYEAARWGSVQSIWTKEATRAQFAASEQLALANRHLSSDLLTFSVWLEAELEGRDVLASAVVGRFRPDFVPAFEAWRALGVGDVLAPGSPFELAEYRLPESVEAERLSRDAEDASRRGADAGETSDRYVLTAVLFASVLFLAGIATKIATPRGSKLAVVLSLVMFVFATVVTFTLPISVGGLR